MSLCLKCNLCCDGTIFTHVELTAEEQNGFLPDQTCDVEGGLIAIPQRCSNLGQDGSCAIYQTRPGKCRAFDCSLLKRLENQEISEDFAALVVAETKAAAARSHRLFDQFLPAQKSVPTSLRLKMIALDGAQQKGEVQDVEFALAQKAFLFVRLLIEDHFKDAPEP